ncbi:MAG: hypothetical protein RL215_2460, partial [Planctomycetota bacterium]
SQGWVLLMVLAGLSVLVCRAEGQELPGFPDMRSVPEDLRVPVAEEGEAGAGRRVFLGSTKEAALRGEPAAVLWLPENWRAGGSWPLLVELPGNGGYRDAQGDECSGNLWDCNLGYGLTAGRDWIWLCLPFLNGDGSRVAKTWWGDAPSYAAAATQEFWQEQLEKVLREYGGDSDCVVLSGFSRGAIAVQALGLGDEGLSRRWAAFLPCSHYDGVRRWPFVGSDSEAAAIRRGRLGNRPQLIMGEGLQVEETRRFLEGTGMDLSRVEFRSTGFRNHSDRWALRPSESRDVARRWLEGIRAVRATRGDQ